jgi:peptidoglycan/LPS O-acetylase OafA/YrhL
MKQRRYVFLDGIRGLAAMLVLTGHTYDYWNFNFYRAYLAVDLFFILSGFVIAHAYEQNLLSGVISLRTFIKIRLIRLYPIYLLSVLLCALLLIGTAVAGHVSPEKYLEFGGAIVATLFFLPFHIRGDDELFPLNGAFWSLFFELFANGLYGCVVRRLNSGGLWAIVVISGLGVAALAFVHGDLNAGFKWTVPHIGAGLLRSIFGIFLGILIYRDHERMSKIFAKLSPWLAFLVVGVVLVSPGAGSFNAVIDIICVCCIFPLCVIVGSRNAATSFEGVLLTLGVASYPVYVLHAPVGKAILLAWPGLVAYAPLSGVFFVAVLIAASVWLERVYDIPLRRRLSNAFVKRVG